MYMPESISINSSIHMTHVYDFVASISNSRQFQSHIGAIIITLVKILVEKEEIKCLSHFAHDEELNTLELTCLRVLPKELM